MSRSLWVLALPLAFALAAALFVVVALAALVVPARRAAATEPAGELRNR